MSGNPYGDDWYRDRATAAPPRQPSPPFDFLIVTDFLRDSPNSMVHQAHAALARIAAERELLMEVATTAQEYVDHMDKPISQYTVADLSKKPGRALRAALERWKKESECPSTSTAPGSR